MGLAGNRSLIAPCDSDHPYLDLAASIIVMAVQDWRTYSETLIHDIVNTEYRRVITMAGFDSPREELVSFFYSEWCLFLLGGFDVSYEAMVEELEKWGLPRWSTRTSNGTGR